MSEPATPPQSSVERWVLWLVGALAVALGAALWWAIGGFGVFGSDPYDGPAHYLNHGCASGDDDGIYLLAPLLLLGAGITLVVKAVRRRRSLLGIGLLVGLFVAFDGVLMFWYVILIGMSRGCD